MTRLAWVTHDRQIAIAGADGRDATLLTADFPVGTGGWSQLARPQLHWAWPTWSPDGRRVAAFVVEPSDERTGPVRVQVLDVDGVHEELWWESGGVAPLYLQWRPDGGALAVLVQRGDELNLLAVGAGALGRARLVEAGVPVFFHWSAQTGHLLIHASEPGEPQGRLVRRDPLGTADDVLFDRPSGSFCAPVLVAGRAAWATPEDGGSLVCVSDEDGAGAHPLLNRKGLVALVAAPAPHRWLAVAASPGGEGKPYDGIDLVDVVTGELRTLTRMPCYAFFWSPTGDWLLVSQVASEDNCLKWWRVPITGGEPVEIGSFWPTRDLLFYLHFFEQYAGSHSLVAPDGRHLVFAGYPAGHGHADLSRPPRVWRKDTTDPEAPAEEVDAGTFAVYSPAGAD